MKNIIIIKNKSAIFSGIIAYAFLAITLMNCAASLVPKYDQSIFENLTIASRKSMELMAATSSGSTNADFIKREDSYNSIIGSIDALLIQVKGRPNPNNKVIDKILKKVNEKLKVRGVPAISGESPTVGALNEILKNISNMKDVDKVQGLHTDAVKAYKGNIVIYLDQAITYESFLKR